MIEHNVGCEPIVIEPRKVPHYGVALRWVRDGVVQRFMYERSASTPGQAVDEVLRMLRDKKVAIPDDVVISTKLLAR